MNGIESTTRRPALGASAPATSRRTADRAALPQLPAFAMRPICSEPVQCLDDVLLSGSDDEYYDDSDARRRRIEEQASLFLEGRRPFLLSASLRGPFGKESGWENPWRGSGRRSTKHMEPREKLLPTAADSQQTTISSRPGNSPPASPALPPLHRELGTIPGISALGGERIQPKKRSASTDWLRQKNLKRMRSADDSGLSPSPTASRVSRSAALRKAFKTPVSARSFSAPVEPRIESAATGTRQKDRSVPLEDSVAAGDSVSHISDSEICASVSSDLLWGSHAEHGQENISSIEIDETIMFDMSSSHNADVMEEDTDADMASQQIAAEEVRFENQRGSSQVPDLSSEGPAPENSIEEHSDISGVLHDASSGLESAAPVELDEDTTLQPFEDTHSKSSKQQSPTPDASNDRSTTIQKAAAHPDEEAVVPTNTVVHRQASEDTEDKRLATQFQSPWSRTQAPTFIDDSIAESEAASTTDTAAQHGAITKPPVASTNTQSPGSRESQWHPSAASSPPAASATPTRNTSISQNPWIEESGPAPSITSSQPNLPTSPCSPSQDVSLPQFPSEQHQEPFLPSLPIPIPTTHSSGTAPSTPDTKQSSLPTPDMTMSIKSFRRFRSPTPTPPPRRRNNKKGGPRSILKQTRWRSRVPTSASTVSRRVHFSLPDDDETRDGDNDCAGTGIEAEEEDFIEAGLSGTSRGRKFTCELQAKGSKAPSRPSRRAASPPPANKTLMESLPSEVEKFRGHFASVAGRANHNVLATAIAAPSCAVKASSSTIAMLRGGEVDVLDSNTDSPAIDAMAARFQQVDADTSKLQQIVSQPSLTASQRPQERTGTDTGTGTGTGINTHSKLIGTVSKDKENAWATATESGNQGGDGDDAESVVDDVQEVMDNLDDFLGMWDMDAELAQVRSSRV
ncbi:hypothetical protein F503_00358 [Ophiostoma piceae UAMH 11346]|uniref:Protamine p1 n=1 Tax=Ophiostoma piceae (strain UAMH 11346) TaxID=1262450 RepID=S3C6V4_OPHP1|nr:hypothetical protein F503_00358 [Ophiostoma piceae UAMH 11346]